ncbi:glycine-rich protein 2-like [Carya illinoinensis]|uniref:Uncharacterized protein n=1 Tax=Carya illinoinensis TaxID=32201 RepID=A0A8T1PEM6_CARIL|nr:glycine-rich protein 2-like [Carya illinoinensis]KAG6640134.1 hypothetical protein CIPAW_10G151300 [Carya illinoinensis]KAG6693101.1 hypothetical protein I3842_10G148300 [Carya illinoinensis]
MVRVFVSELEVAAAHADGGSDNIAFVSSGGLVLLGMIVTFLSIVSMVIFACGDPGDDNTPRKKKREAPEDCGDCSCFGDCGDGGGGGDGDGGGGGGDGGGGGGGCGGGGGGGGCGGGGGGGGG